MAGAGRRPVTLRTPDFALDLDDAARPPSRPAPGCPPQLAAQPDRQGVLDRAELDRDRRGRARARPARRHRRGLRAPRVRRRAHPARTLPGMAERTVTISSAGKTFSLHRLEGRLGVRPAPLVAAVRTAKQFLTYVNGGPFQPAVAVGLALPDAVLRRRSPRPAGKRDRLCAGLERGRLRGVPPAGHLLRHRRHPPARRARRLEFCRSLPERCGVVAIPNVVFYDDKEAGRPLVRFAFCKRTWCSTRPSSAWTASAREELGHEGRRVQHDIVWEDRAANRRHVEPHGRRRGGGGRAPGRADRDVRHRLLDGGRPHRRAGRRPDVDVAPGAGRDPRRLAVRLGGRAPRRGGSPATRRARRSGRHHAPLRQDPPVHLRRRARALRRRRRDGHRRGGRAPRQPLRLLRPALRRRLLAAGPDHRRLRRPAPTGPRPGGPTGGPSCRPGPSRTRRTCSASTGSARAAA